MPSTRSANTPVLPNLVVIGAAKAGTTSLHRYLDAHPGIAMSGQKELQFFTSDDWSERIDWYRSQFDPRAPVRGESTPGYTMYPYLPSTAERMAELIPDARLIYVVRDPIERAIANYVELVALRLEDRPIDEALADVGTAANPHICASRYATQLERFLRHFDRDRILVVDQLELKRDRAATVREAFRFLGVDERFESPAFEEMHNLAGSKVRYNRLGFWMVRHGILAQRRGAFRRGPLIRPLRGLLSRPIPRSLAPETERLLIGALTPEVERLRELSDKPFAGWAHF